MNHSKSFAISAVAGLLGVAMSFVSASALAYTPQEQANIKVVADFYDALNARDAAGGESKMPIRPIAEKYLAENYHQNSPGLTTQGQGREALIKMFQGMGREVGGSPPGGAKPAPAKVYFISAQGDMVVRVSALGPAGVIFNMFRVENGKLVEHWDAVMGGAERGGAGGPPAGGPPAGAPGAR